MLAKEIRQKYLEFFQEKGHTIIPSASLIPENDPTVLFTTAGMHPLVPFLLGEPHPSGKRLVNFQKCIRTIDIDEVGDDTHLTFFEMLGNWSLGDYFKEDTIRWSLEFLVSPDWLNIPFEKLAISIFKGDDDAPQDTEAAEFWKKLGIPEHKIVYLPKKDNWWGPAGKTGPCGPDTEIFYYANEGNPPEESNPENDENNWIEIWNDVFLQYNKTVDGKYEPLQQKNVDTGMGLERVAAVLQGKRSVYDIELLRPIMKKIEALASVSYEENQISYRIITDHIRTTIMMAGDGVVPSNLDQGYVMRRLIRRAIRHGKIIGIEQDFTATIAKKAIHSMSDIYPVLKHEEKILEVFRREEEHFRKTINHGLREFEKLVSKMEGDTIGGTEAFHLYDTYGFPLEMTEELAKERNLSIDTKGFDIAFQEHQKKSRAGAEQKFQGGLQDDSEATTNLHTATHLLHAALRKVLGDHVQQRGSNITAERLRFDFSHTEKVTPEQITEVEQLVNEAIQSDIKVDCENMTTEEAKKAGAIGLFENKYGDQVKVYTMDKWSKEICGGPHVEQLGKLGQFKIKKEQSCGAGIRRIKAVLTP